MPQNPHDLDNDAISNLSIDDDAYDFNISNSEPVERDFGAGDDTVNVTADDDVKQVRVTFTSSEVGNGNASDSNTMVNQDGGLAVRAQAESASGALEGPVSRFDDEGISFVSDGTFTFDVRDLVSGVARGDQFEVVRLGTNAADTFDETGSARATYINAGMGDDVVTGGSGNDFLVGGAGNDVLNGASGNDSFIGGGANDTIRGGEGDDIAIFNVSTDGSDTVDLGFGRDNVNVAAAASVSQVRLTFTSAEVGNKKATDGGVMVNQDGGLAVRLQAEDASGALSGLVSRFDDEGMNFISTVPGLTFDVRDLVSGAARGDQFSVVRLGTIGNDIVNDSARTQTLYINAGMGNDVITGGSNNDFLVGGAGMDTLSGNSGNDSFIGGGGNDTISGGIGNDTAIFNIGTDGSDTVDLGTGSDTVNVAAPVAASQVRVTFTSSEVGNGNASDSNTMLNQDGGLAVRLQAEDGAGGLTGLVSRFDDEGISFVSTVAGVTFDVRDLVSGVARGDQFEVVRLGTNAADTFDETGSMRATYINAGMGDDSVVGGSGNDFLVGGAGNDILNGASGNDSFIGGGANDTIRGGEGDDIAIFNVSTDGSDTVDLGFGRDNVNVAAAASVSQVRLTFTSAEVGNKKATDGGVMVNQDGGLAVRLQAEDASGALSGLVSRFDDEGMNFISTVPGLTFDVRDLVSGAARGDQFSVVRLGTIGNDIVNDSARTQTLYINAGMGNDVITGGSNNDFLVGGAGMDTLSGNSGNDSFIGGGGNDTISGGIGNDTAIFNIGTDGSDTVDLGAGSDTVNVAAPVAASQVRVTFTSSEVGNGNASDSNTMLNQDGGLAVRLQAEDGAGGLTGLVSRFDDEGISFVSTVAGVTFDVRDLVSGVARGDQFEVVRLGTNAADTFDETGSARATYINAGMGDDVVTGGSGNDFLVGGAGNDVLNGASGNDSFIGGGGSDTIVFSDAPGNDTINDFVSGTDKIDLSAFNIDFADITATMVGSNTMLDVDTDNDEVSDFNITLLNSVQPVESDYIFA